jgi:hypothetical protein
MENIKYKHGQTFIDNCLVRGRVVTLRNITLWYDKGHYCTCEDKICAGWCPEFRNFGSLSELLRAHPDINDFTFDSEENVWRLTVQ